jgi:hypothetical protein
MAGKRRSLEVSNRAPRLPLGVSGTRDEGNKAWLDSAEFDSHTNYVEHVNVQSIFFCRKRRTLAKQMALQSNMRQFGT